MMPHAEITWKGMVLELLSEKEIAEFGGEGWATETMIESCSRALETAPCLLTSTLLHIQSLCLECPLAFPSLTNVVKGHFLQEVFPDLTRVGWLCDSLPWKFPTLTLVPAPP